MALTTSPIGPSDAVVALEAPITFSGETSDYFEMAHSEAFELNEGTFAVSFTVAELEGRQTLFSKDHHGRQEGGHLTAQVIGDRVEVRLQSAEKSVYLESAEGSIRAGEEHHVAVSFGSDGFRLYVDGLPADGAVDFPQGIAANDKSLVLGASTTRRIRDNLSLREPLDGVLHTFAVYDTAADLAGAAALADLDLSRPTNHQIVAGVLHGTDDGDSLWGRRLEGGYGDDVLNGTAESDVLAGGHGEDVVKGGFGDDVLISRSDGREPVIAQDYDGEDDPDGEVDPRTRTLYPEQPIAADDLLIGGGGADTFRFEILLNAKERILFKHVRDDGTINWKGVTGENRDVHDHWVDRIGDEVIMDFDRSEGDKIEFVGHTVDVYLLEHLDTDGDGVLDASVLHVQSNQGPTGAHNKDQLGTVTVYGDLVRESDYTVHAHANLGIVETIGELGEALAPRQGDPAVTDGESRWRQETVLEEIPLPENAVFAVGQPLAFSGERDEYVRVEHDKRFELNEGTFAVSFRVEETDGVQALFSKDHNGYQEGGHLTAQVAGDRVEVRLQSATRSVRLSSENGSVVAGHDHQVAVSFGPSGFRLFVDGELVDDKPEFTQGIADNTTSLVLGASTKHRVRDNLSLRDEMRGVIHEFAVYPHEDALTHVALDTAYWLLEDEAV